MSRDKESVRRGPNKPLRAPMAGNDVIELNPTFPSLSSYRIVSRDFSCAETLSPSGNSAGELVRCWFISDSLWRSERPTRGMGSE